MSDYDLQHDALGFISFEWEGAPSGVIDAFSGGTALIGLDEAIRFFNRKQAGDFGRVSYELPVKTTEGSWLVLVIGALLFAGGKFAGSYLSKAGEKMAERDFDEVGFKDVIHKSLDAFERLIELIKHTKKLDGWQTQNKLESTYNATIVGVENDDGEILYMPVEYLKWFSQIPKSIMKKIVTPVAKGRELKVGVRDESNGFRTVKVNVDDVSVFLDEEIADDEDILFPELEHGDTVILEGLITRGNQETNTIGFLFQNHILNCIPGTGSIKRYKPAMFLHCRIHATVNRHVASLGQPDKRPTLIVDAIEPLETDHQGQTSLFE